MDHIRYEDFFICLSQLVQSIEIQELNNLVNVRKMIENIIQQILNRPIYEQRLEDGQDKVLGGQMYLCVSLLQIIDKEEKNSLSQQFDLVNKIYEFLFFSDS